MKKFISLASVAALAISSLWVVSAMHAWGSACHNFVPGYGYVTVNCPSPTVGWWGWGSWGWSSSAWSSSLQRDYCPDGDMTFSYYDGLCDDWVAAETNTNSDTTTTTDTGTTTTSNTSTTSGPVTVVTTTTTATDDTVTVTPEEVNTINDIRDTLQNNNSWGTPVVVPPTISLPSFLPETGASL